MAMRQRPSCIAAAAVALLAVAHVPIALGQAKPLAKQAAPKTITSSPLTFEGVYAGTKTINAAPLAFEGTYAGTKKIDAAPLSFVGLYGGVRTINASALSFEGMGQAPASVKPPVNIKGVHK